MVANNEAQTIPVTTARSRLFELVEEVLTGRTSRVELAHRGYSEHVVLLRKGELEGIEADLAALRARAAPEPRPLRGLGRLAVEPDQLLVRARERQSRLAAAKRASLRSGDSEEDAGAADAASP